MQERHVGEPPPDPAYGWLVVGTLAVTVTVSYGVLTYAFGIVLVPMQRELGWSRIELAGAFSLALAAWALAGVPVGMALDRYSPRTLLTGGSAPGAGPVPARAQTHSRPDVYPVLAGR